MKQDEQHPDDRGESLIELLVSIAILGIAVVAILGAIAMSSSASSLHRSQAQAQNFIRNWAEAVSGQAYQPCRTSGVIMPGDAGGPAALPTGYSAAAPQISYWTGSAWGACPGSGDKGLQRMRLVLTAPSSTGSFDQSLYVVVRNSCAAVTDPGC